MGGAVDHGKDVGKMMLGNGDGNWRWVWLRVDFGMLAGNTFSGPLIDDTVHRVPEKTGGN